MPAVNDISGYSDGLSLQHWIGKGFSTPTLDRLAEFLSPHALLPLLDTGCGTGQLILELQERGVTDVYGCDIEPGHAELARRRTGAPIADAYFNEGNPFPGIQFGTVVAMNWLQTDWPAELATGIPPSRHTYGRLVDATRVVQEVLRPGGWFVWDWHKPDCGARYGDYLRERGWTLFETLTFEGLPENYPIYIYQRP